MNNSKLEKIVKLDGSQIYPNMLINETLTIGDEMLIRPLRKSLRKKYIINFICLSLFFIGIVSLFIYEFLISKRPIDSTFFFILIFLFAILFFLINIFKKIATLNNSYTAQYGIVSSKYILKTRTSNTNTIEKYYLNVKFPTYNTYIRRVITTSKSYNILNEGDRVIVISFDNKEAHGIHL